MATTSAANATLTTRVVAGVVGGLVGGVVFGMLMQMMGMITTVAQLIGSGATAVGWLVHLFNSALFGAIFALIVGQWAGRIWPALGLGLVYGVVWWVVGALLIMPAWLGMSEMIFTVDSTAVQSLMGHMIYGLLLGGVFVVVAPRLSRS